VQLPKEEEFKDMIKGSELPTGGQGKRPERKMIKSMTEKSILPKPPPKKNTKGTGANKN